MSMLTLLTVDRMTLPMALLSPLKSHMRVEYPRDDLYIVNAIGRAMDEIEAATNLSLFAATWQWWLSASDLEVPKTPLKVLKGEDGIEIPLDPASVSLGYGGSGEPGRVVLQPEIASSNAWVTLEVGYAAPEEIPPRVTSALFQLTASLYENREAVTMGAYALQPDFTRRLLTGLWMPSV